VHNDRMRKRMDMSSGYDDSAASPAFTLSALQSRCIRGRRPAPPDFPRNIARSKCARTHPIRKPDRRECFVRQHAAAGGVPEQAQIRRRARERRLRFLSSSRASTWSRVEALDRFAEPPPVLPMKVVRRCTLHLPRSSEISPRRPVRDAACASPIGRLIPLVPS